MARLWAVLPALGLLFSGLLVELLPPEEVYASLDYGFSLVALLGAAGCMGHLAILLSRASAGRAFACCLPAGAPAEPAAPSGVTHCSHEWPVLVALLFGPLPVLLAGLGGWV